MDLLDKEFNALKILHHMDRLQSLAVDEDIAPVTVEIDPVAYCNHQCGWCVDPVHYRKTMALPTFDRLITDLQHFTINDFQVKGIVFKGGGEPTLHPQFDHMLESATAAGFSIGIVTNGSRLSQWYKMMATHAAYVRISIDGPTATSHHRIHRSHDFAKIIDGVKQLVKARGKQRHPVIGLSFAMDADTFLLADQAIALGEKLGVDYILLRPPFFEEVGHASTMSINQAQQVRSHLRQTAQQYQGDLQVLIGDWVGDVEQIATANKVISDSGRRDSAVKQRLPIEHRLHRCLASPLLAVITASGELYGCCNLRALSDWSFGRLDYDKGIDLTHLWNSPKRRQRLAKMHCTDCIKHCTHPLSRYNEIIETLRDPDQFHCEFV